LWKLSDNSTFETTFYRVTSEKIGENIRAVVLADLHNNVFGQDNEPLVFKIRQLEPDVILMAGDMINGDDPDVSGILELCVKLKDIAPIYYSLGNNEGVLMYSPEGPQVPLDVELLEEGVTVLYNNSVDTEIRGNKVSIGAVTSEPADFAEMSQALNNPQIIKFCWRIIQHCSTTVWRMQISIFLFPDIFMAGSCVCRAGQDCSIRGMVSSRNTAMENLNCQGEN